MEQIETKINDLDKRITELEVILKGSTQFDGFIKQITRHMETVEQSLKDIPDIIDKALISHTKIYHTDTWKRHWKILVGTGIIFAIITGVISTISVIKSMI